MNGVHFKVETLAVNSMFRATVKVKLKAFEVPAASKILFRDLGKEHLLLGGYLHNGSMAIHYNCTTRRQVAINHVEVVFLCVNCWPS